jgi:hypothetical protein
MIPITLINILRACVKGILKAISKNELSAMCDIVSAVPIPMLDRMS